MKKDLTKYYAVVWDKFIPRVLTILRNQGDDLTLDQLTTFVKKRKNDILMFDGNRFFLKNGIHIGQKEITIKTFSQYVLDNERLESFNLNTKKLQLLTEENTTLANGNKELLQKCVFLENEVKILQGTEQKKEEVISIQNDMLEVKELENETLKKELNAKSVALILVSFTLTIALIFIAQKL